MSTTKRAAICLAVTLTVIWGAQSIVLAITPAEIFKKSQNACMSFHSLQMTYLWSVRLDGSNQGNSQANNIPIRMVIQQPDKFRVEFKSPMFSMTAVCDGKQFWQYNPSLKQVKVSKVPKQFKCTPDGIRTLLGGSPMGMPGVGQTTDSIPDSMLKSARLLGTARFNGKETYLLQINGGNGKTKLWIGTRDFLTYKTEMQADMGAMMSAPGGLSGAGKPGNKPGSSVSPSRKTVLTFSLVARDVKINKPVPAGIFKFVKPEDARIVKTFSGEMPNKKPGH